MREGTIRRSGAATTLFARLLPSRSIRSFGVALGLLALGACEYGTTDLTEPQELGGRYVLRSVDGSPLPFVIAELGDSWTEFVDGRLDVDRDHMFQLYLGLREVQDDQEAEFSETSAGTWSRSGSQLTLVDGFGRTRYASVDGNQVTLSGNYTYVFSR